MVFVICPYCRPSATMDVAEAAPAGAGADFGTRLKTEVAEAAPAGAGADFETRLKTGSWCS